MIFFELYSAHQKESLFFELANKNTEFLFDQSEARKKFQKWSLKNAFNITANLVLCMDLSQLGALLNKTLIKSLKLSRIKK